MDFQVYSLMKWNAVCHWVKDMGDENCSICKDSFRSICMRCIVKDDATIPCNIVRGECMHSYHQHCLEHYFETSKTAKCLLCNFTWNTIKQTPIERS